MKRRNLLIEQEIEQELDKVIALYDQLVEQSDKLADFIYYKSEYILGKVMPKNSQERRDSSRIRKWFDECKPEVLEHIAEMETAENRKKAREKLIVALNLTDEQKALLFDSE